MIRLRILGSTELHDAYGRDITTVLAQPKRLALLAYLATSDSFVRRDTLLAMFWPELDSAKSHRALNQAVRFLRKQLGGSPESLILSRGAEEIGLESDSVWCDAARFRELIDGKRYAEGLELYRGDLLPGFFSARARGFEEWLELARARFRAMAARAASEVAEASERDQNFTTAVTSARRAAELSGFDERAVRELLLRLDRLGDRAGAIHAYDEFARRLADELETEPSAETQAVIDVIRSRAASGPGHADRPATFAGDFLAASPMPFAGVPSGQIADEAIDGWRLVHELARGGMARVYKVFDAKHDRYVALKVMRPDRASFGTERFLREIQISARLAHPHILPLIDSGARDGLPYLVTPYVAGESLRARLNRETKLSVDDALRLAEEIAEALDYAHRCGILHCDIKPENILLADGHAIVADFGIARAIAAAEANDETTSQVPVIGSPPYMSPESLAGTSVGVRTDIYALGCVLVEMLSGSRPSPNSEERVSSLLSRLSLAPRAAATLAEDCAAINPARRPQTAAEVVRRLEMARHDATSAGMRAGQRAGARSWRQALSAAAVVVAMAGLVAGFVQSRSHTLVNRRVAVAPFENLTTDTALAQIGRIAADWIAQGAGQQESLDVVPTTTVFTALANAPSDGQGIVRHLARETHASIVVTGTFSRVGDSVRVSATIIDARDHRALRVIGPEASAVADPLSAVTALRDRVLGFLAFGDADRTVALASKVPRLDAYRALIDAQDHWGHDTVAQRSLHRAIELDSTFHYATFLLALTHIRLGEIAVAESLLAKVNRSRERLSVMDRLMLDGWLAILSGNSDAEAMYMKQLAARDSAGPWLFDLGDATTRLLRPREAVTAFRAMDSASAALRRYGYLPLMALAYHEEGDFSSELATLRRARRLVPVYEDLTIGYPAYITGELRALAGLGRQTAALALADTLLAGTSDATIRRLRAVVIGAREFRAHGDSVGARRLAGAALAWCAAHPEARLQQREIAAGGAWLLLGNADSAAAHYRRADRDAPNLESIALLGIIAARQGDTLRARVIADSLAVERSPRTNGEHAYWRAALLAQIGHQEEAIILLREATHEGQSMASWHADEALRSLRGNASFAELLKPRG